MPELVIGMVIVLIAVAVCYFVFRDKKSKKPQTMQQALGSPPPGCFWEVSTNDIAHLNLKEITISLNDAVSGEKYKKIFYIGLDKRPWEHIYFNNFVKEIVMDRCETIKKDTYEDNPWDGIYAND